MKFLRVRNDGCSYKYHPRRLHLPNDPASRFSREYTSAEVMILVATPGILGAVFCFLGSWWTSKAAYNWDKRTDAPEAPRAVVAGSNHVCIAFAHVLSSLGFAVCRIN